MRRPAYLWCVAGPPRSTPTRMLVVEQHEVDGHLERGGRDIVLGVEEGVVLHRDVPDVAVAVDAHRAEIDAARAPELVQQGERLARGLRHRVHQVETGARVCEDVRDEDPLADLEALLVLLQQLTLGCDGGAARKLLGKPLGSGVDEIGNARLLAVSVGELAVDRVHVAAEVLDPRGLGLAWYRAARLSPWAGCRARARACRPRSAERSPAPRS